MILVADDDLVMRCTMRAVLEEAGYDVLEAADGTEALTLACAHTPDLLILDLIMPGMDGFELCERIRATPSLVETPILVLTGLDDSSAIHRAFETGASDFVTKPLSPALLSHRVRFMLRSVDVLQDLRDSENRLAEAQRLARLGNWEWDLQTGMIAGSPEAFSVLGLRTDAGRIHIEALSAMIAPSDLALLAPLVEAAVDGETTFDATCRVSLADGRDRHVHLLGQALGRLSGGMRIVGTIQDVTERTHAEDRIRSLAYFDALTGLPNRLMFTERVRGAMSAARRNNTRLALLLVDLDNFKGINDTLGHAAGDLVLAEVGARLRRVVREHDTVSHATENDGFLPVSRLGGDEFLVAITDLASGEEAASIARRIISVLGAPMRVDSTELSVGGSIGISVFPDDGTDFDELFKNADVALYHAKDAGRNTSEFFSASMNETAMYRMLIETSLRRSLEREEMTVHYQPQVNVLSGRVLRVEALLRWTHPDIGSISPSQFIPLAERIGLIAPLTEFVMHAACAQLAEWHRMGSPELGIAINLSAQLFRQKEFLTQLIEIPATYGVRPECVEFEITETTLLDARFDADQMLKAMRERGFRIALDDFGVGYSSLSHLRRFALDTLKIDRSFISELVDGARELEIVTALIGLAQRLGIEPVAEGVEEPGQRTILLSSGCRVMQGYLIGRPVPAAAITRLVCDGVSAR
jgi:diguanylate cyclase (GGDEF)-like protein